MKKVKAERDDTIIGTLAKYGKARTAFVDRA